MKINQAEVQNTNPSLLALQATALQTAANAIMITDRAGIIKWINPAFTRLTGYDPVDVLEHNPRLLKSGQHNHSFYKKLWGTLLSGKTWQGEFTNRRKDGTLYHDEHTITPVRGATGEVTHFVAIMADITDRKTAEAQVQKLNEELEHRVRERTRQLESANQELETFAYSVSHDLRAPLRGIDGLTLAVLQDCQGLDAVAKELLERVRMNTQRMNALIDGLLRFSRMAQVPLCCEKVDLTLICRQVLADLQSRESGRRAEFVIAENLVVQGDPVLLRAVMENLLSNAWKFTTRKPLARICVGIDSNREQPGTPGNGEQPDSRHSTVFFVQDNGAGFDMNYAEKLFGPFQRLHAQEEFIGNGIGLATVQRILQRHGGRIWAESKPDGGAVFFFTLSKSPS